MMRRIVRMFVLGIGATGLPLLGCGGLDGTADGPVASDAKVAPDAAVCDQLAAAARTQFESYLPCAASLACQVDSDCTLLSTQSLNCVAACGRLLRAADVPAVTAAAAGVCDQYFGAGCPAMYPPCPGGYGNCENGGCVIGPRRGGPSGSTDAAVEAGAPDVSPAVDLNVISDVPVADISIAIDLPDTSDAKVAPDAAVCDQLAAAALAQFNSHLQSASSLACQVDSDCSLLDLRSLDCFSPCGQLVGTADISAVTAGTAGICNEYFGAGCPEKIVPCLPFRVVCDHNTCAASPGFGGLSGATDAAVDAGAGEVPTDGGAG